MQALGRSRAVHRAIVITLIIAIGLVAEAATAQQGVGGPQPGNYLNGTLDAYNAAMHGWRDRLIPIAQRTFVILAAIEFAVSGIVWAIKRESLDDLAAKFLLKFTLIAFLLTLITSFNFWLPPLFNGFITASQDATGLRVITPNDIVRHGAMMAWNVIKALYQTPLAFNFTMGMVGTLAAVFIAGAFVVVAVELMLVMVETYIVVFGGGVLFLGFAASRWTAAYAEHLVGYTVYLGARAFFLYLIVGVGLQVTDGMQALVTVQTILAPNGALIQLVATVVTFAILANRLPREAAWKLTGRHSIGLANALRHLA